LDLRKQDLPFQNDTSRAKTAYVHQQLIPAERIKEQQKPNTNSMQLESKAKIELSKKE
jgi:hypothetical protein